MPDVYDSPWKEMLELYFPQFMAFFFPDAHADVDWTHGYESLEQELREVVRDAEIGRRLADKLMKVRRRDGREQDILVHLEVQGEREESFPQRMFVYNYRVFDRHNRPVVSLAVLGDDHPEWRPDRFGYDLWGCEVRIRFPVVKLWDYNDRWDELEASDNPFALVVMAHLKTRATRQRPAERLRWKLRLVRHLYERGYGRQEILELFRFLDWMMTLPEELEERFRGELEDIEEEKRMRYVTSIERHGIQKGIVLGESSLLKRQLTSRYGELPRWAAERLEGADRQQLESWGERLLHVQGLEEVFGSE